MMRVFVGVVLMLSTSSVLAEDCYSKRYDMFDVDILIQNPRLLKKYMDCFLNKGPCSPIGRVFKSALPEVISSACAKCTMPQKKFAWRAFNAFRIYWPESYAELRKTLDPDNKYYKAFEKNVASA